MSHGSMQLRLYRRFRREGESIEDAARNPPSEGCYWLSPGMARSYVAALVANPTGDPMSDAPTAKES